MRRAAFRDGAVDLCRGQLARLAGGGIDHMERRGARERQSDDVEHVAQVLAVVDLQRIGNQLRAREVRGDRQREMLAGDAFSELLGFRFPCHGTRYDGLGD